jgi:hypothetical protein
MFGITDNFLRQIKILHQQTGNLSILGSRPGTAYTPYGISSL